MKLENTERKERKAEKVADVVVIGKAEKVGEPTVITANCPNKTGLGCDLCRVILLFGRSICRGGFGDTQAPHQLKKIMVKAIASKQERDEKAS
ncbi:unnamed protein product [Prunus armeniaca]|uniref:ACT domain-containing protein n=1 Tax=Prunus armeniaca TaxID=36596 RepID=A0A6J5VQQ3_PRUAR|nr:unnamed protein product [Prunus armeniaca]